MSAALPYMQHLVFLKPSNFRRAPISPLELATSSDFFLSMAYISSDFIKENECDAAFSKNYLFSHIYINSSIIRC